MHVIFSIDVEEEGLFSGAYPRRPPGVASAGELRRLGFVREEFGIPLTLLVTHPVAADPASAATLVACRGRGDEIGAHLHVWNTPPFREGRADDPPHPDDHSDQELRAKVEELICVLAPLAGDRPVSFRMGRYDLTPAVVRLLRPSGLRADGSVVPGRGSEFFLAPADPFPLAEGVVEAPLTVVPLWHRMAVVWHRLSRRLPPGAATAWRTAFRRIGMVGMQPAWFPLASMMWAARLHEARGGRYLHLSLHSTELLPGASPRFPTPASVDRLMGRIRRFLRWLAGRGAITGVTLSRAVLPTEAHGRA